ncbi:hypothetical protein P691DRAFT_835411 [Macrolepiota fuliginosa MF-IS2]|uniref:Uncharacterized protein n=1 Tax=Macrolepiota fuliginosa MF-IS2 TaxID=1400762 RepID=A0A9P6CB11_9AGAR|nr:hypothetical protein P691DRAFT_835411 [Macrolepiota fuliginosa MF-IS2]
MSLRIQYVKLRKDFFSTKAALDPISPPGGDTNRFSALKFAVERAKNALLSSPSLNFLVTTFPAGNMEIKDIVDEVRKMDIVVYPTTIWKAKADGSHIDFGVAQEYSIALANVFIRSEDVFILPEGPVESWSNLGRRRLCFLSWTIMHELVHVLDSTLLAKSFISVSSPDSTGPADDETGTNTVVDGDKGFLVEDALGGRLYSDGGTIPFPPSEDNPTISMDDFIAFGFRERVHLYI